VVRELVGPGTVAIEDYLQLEHAFPFPLAKAKLKSDAFVNRQSGDKIFLLAITPPIYWRI
jgi:hypothetical protein